jgi:hypothetical protein
MALEPFDIASLPVPAQRIVGAEAQPRMKQMAAKGIVPGLRPDALVAVIALLTQDSDRAIADEATATLGKLPPPVMQGALGADLHPWVIDVFSRAHAGDRDVLARLLAMPRVSLDTVEDLAKTGTEPVTELIATNEERLLANPKIIAALYLNKATRMSTADRIVELATRNGVEVQGIPAWREVSTAIKGELIVEATEEALPDDQLFYEQDALATELSDEAAEDAFYEDDEGKEKVQDRYKPLAQRLAEMSVSQRVRRAMLGTKEERMILVREQNKVISAAAARSPLLKEGEVAQIARNRNVTDEVLRIIGTTPEWLKSYQVKRNLVENSKTPLAIAAALIPQLREADLRKLAGDRNVSSAIQMAARRHLQRRRH